MQTYISWVSYHCQSPTDKCPMLALTAMLQHDEPEPKMLRKGFLCPGCGNVAQEVHRRTERASDLQTMADAQSA